MAIYDPEYICRYTLQGIEILRGAHIWMTRRREARIIPLVMAGTSPRLSGLIPADGARGLSTSGLPTVRASRDTVFGAPASPRFPRSSVPAVMAGLVPAIHVLLHRGASREGTGRRSHVDARNESGVTIRGRWRRTFAPPARAPRCHPGLEPGSRPAPDRDPGKAGRERCPTVWTPAQGRGDSGGAETVSHAGTEPVPKLNRTAMEPVQA